MSRLLLRLLLPAELRDEFVRQADERFAADVAHRGPRAALRAYRREILDPRLLALRREWPARHRIVERQRGGHVARVLSDLRFALRMCRRYRTVSLAVILTLAIGIGATTAVVSVIYSVLLTPLPFPDPDRLVAIESLDTREPRPWTSVGYVDLQDWQEGAESLEAAAAYAVTGLTLTGHGDPTRLRGLQVTNAFDRVLGVRPRLGSWFAADDHAPGGAPALLLTDARWRRLGADPAIVGTTLLLEGQPWEVRGVLPPMALEFPRPGYDFWAPLRLEQEWQSLRGPAWLQAIGRLRPDVELGVAQEEMRALGAALASTYPGTNRDKSFRLVPLQETMVGDLDRQMLLIAGAVIALLLIACGNVANLLQSRSRARRREFAVRAALGARTRAIFRQVLLESVTLAAVGGAAGVALAAPLRDALLRLSPGPFPRQAEIGIGLEVLALSALVTLATGILFGIAPARLAARRSLRFDLVEDAASTGVSENARRYRGVLVAAQTALSVSLLIGAMLLVRSFISLTRVDPGFDGGQVLTFALDPDAARYADDTALRLLSRALLDEVSGSPGVTGAALTSHLPFAAGVWGMDYSIVGEPEPEPGDRPGALLHLISPDYFEILGVPLRAGRAFRDSDTEEAPPVTVIAQSVAEQHWPGRDPVGERIRLSDREWEIVGVVGDVRGDLSAAPQPAIYLPLWQQPRRSLYVLAATTGAPGQAVATARAAVSAVDPTLPLTSVATVRDRVSGSVASERLRATLPAALALVATLLAIVGAYAMTSDAVAARRHELGVRLALGARPRELRRVIIVSGLTAAAGGCAVGAAAAALLSRSVEAFLFGVGRLDAVTFIAAPTLVLAACLLACIGPAARAGRIEAVEALRD